MSFQKAGFTEAHVSAPLPDAAAAPAGAARPESGREDAGSDATGVVQDAAGMQLAAVNGAGDAQPSAPVGASSAVADVMGTSQASRERPGAGSGDFDMVGLPNDPAAVEPALTAQGSDGRRGSGGGRRGSGGSLGSRQLAGSELTFGAMLPSDGRKRSSSQADAALSRLPPVEDIAAEVWPLFILSFRSRIFMSTPACFCPACARDPSLSFYFDGVPVQC